MQVHDQRERQHDTKQINGTMQNQGVGKGNWRIGNALAACQNR